MPFKCPDCGRYLPNFMNTGYRDLCTDCKPVRNKEPATIGWITDSHIGKEYGGYGNSKWDISPLADLSDMIDVLTKYDLDTIVYTGDLFHNNKDGIDELDAKIVKHMFKRFSDNVLPIQYILGNHACDDGRQIWRNFENQEIAAPLSTNPYLIKNTALYGINFNPDSWWNGSLPELDPAGAKYRVLCIHQSVEPFRKSNTAEFDLTEMIPKLSRSIDGVPELILLGHIHEPIDEEIDIDRYQVRVLNNGATTRIGQRYSSFAPGCSIIKMQSDSIQYQRFTTE